VMRMFKIREMLNYSVIIALIFPLYRQADAVYPIDTNWYCSHSAAGFLDECSSNACRGSVRAFACRETVPCNFGIRLAPTSQNTQHISTERKPTIDSRVHSES
jgi:hypothetical protein